MRWGRFGTYSSGSWAVRIARLRQRLAGEPWAGCLFFCLSFFTCEMGIDDEHCLCCPEWLWDSGGGCCLRGTLLHLQYVTPPKKTTTQTYPVATPQPVTLQVLLSSQGSVASASLLAGRLSALAVTDMPAFIPLNCPSLHPL